MSFDYEKGYDSLLNKQEELFEERGKLIDETIILKDKLNFQNKLQNILFFIFVFCLIVMITTIVMDYINSSPKPTHCIIEENKLEMIVTDGLGNEVMNTMEVEGFRLVGVVEWRSDLQLGTYPTIERALEVAELLSCNVSHSERE